MANSYNLTCSACNQIIIRDEMKLFTFRYIHTDESTESEVNLSVSYFKKLKPQEIGNLNLKPFKISNTHVT